MASTREQIAPDLVSWCGPDDQCANRSSMLQASPVRTRSKVRLEHEQRCLISGHHVVQPHDVLCWSAKCVLAKCGALESRGARGRKGGRRKGGIITGIGPPSPLGDSASSTDGRGEEGSGTKSGPRAEGKRNEERGVSGHEAR
jgi:hypothetical protein